MNSILQQLFFSEFGNRILHAQWVCQEKENSPEFDFFNDLKDCFAHLEQKDGSSWNSSEWINSFSMVSNNRVNTYLQEDAHEFLTSFFDVMSIILPYTNDPDILNDLFKSTMKISIECPNCHSVSSHSEVWYCIPLEVEDVFSLDDSLKQFMLPETISGIYLLIVLNRLCMWKLPSGSEWSKENYSYQNSKEFGFPS